MTISVPYPAIVALIGPSACGKSTFARRFFKPTEILSADQIRGWLSDDEKDQSVHQETFSILWQIAKVRLAKKKLVVVDATNLEAVSRQITRETAKAYGVPAIAIVFNLPKELIEARNKARTERVVPQHALDRHYKQLGETLSSINNEGFTAVYEFTSEKQVETSEIQLNQK